MHRSLGMYLTAEETPEPSARRLSMKAVRTVFASNGIPYIQIRSLGLHSTLEMKKEGENIKKTDLKKTCFLRGLGVDVRKMLECITI